MTFYAHHVCLKVTDLERSQLFYREKLGFVPAAEIRHTPEVVSCFLASADGKLQLQLLHYPGIQADPAYGHLGMQVADIRQSFAFHDSLGCVSQGIVEQPHQFGYFIKDPDGYETELCQLKEAGCPDNQKG